MNKKQIITLLLIGISICSFSQEWTLVWSDEFNTDGLPDNSKWSFDTEGNNWDWGNDEAQNYTPADNNNAWVEDGNLVIEARKEQYYWAGDGETKDYTSARLITQGKGDWLYGKVEVKALLPTGTGMWPAIWMLPTDSEYGGWPSSGELDIMENVGYEPNVIHCNIHTEAYNHSIGTNKGNSTTISDPHTNWHIYSLEWNEENVSFFCDGNLVFSFDNEHNTYKEWPFDKPFHLLLNIAVGGGWGGTNGIDDNIFPQQMLVDYVRVYEESNTPIEQTPYGGIPHTIPDTIQCEDFDNGGQGVAYNDNTATNEGGEYRTDEAVDIQISSDDDGSYNIGWTTQGEWLEYTVNVTETEYYKLILRVASNGDGGELSLYSDGIALASNISIPNTGDWQNWTNVVVDSINLSAGEHIIRIEIAASDVINLNYISFEEYPTQNNTVQLKTGWNLIGYPLSESKTVETALESIWSEIDAIKDYENFYIKANQPELNSLTELSWGKGYYIKVSEDCELVW